MNYKMGTLYAFINQAQYDIWAKDTSICEPCVERFFREVGTTRIKYSKERLVTPFVPIKPGGCIRIIQKYPALAKTEEVVATTVNLSPHAQTKPHGFLCRLRKFFGIKS